MHLTDRKPRLDASDLVARFVPPHRFEDVRFDTYQPDHRYPTQAQARRSLEEFAKFVRPAPPRRLWRRTSKDDTKRARYLDGGFGTGKTHLLAALWHASPAPKAYLTFTELTAFIGFVGMAHAIEAFSDHYLLCIDEFELDDVANTLMVVSFLRGAMTNRLRLAVTSNTLPDRLGEQRFSAADFRREIAAIAAYFDELRVDGPDYRSGHSTPRLAEHETTNASDTISSDSFSSDSFDDLIHHLRGVHPVQFGALFDGVDGVVITGLHQITDQDDALTFVQFVDKLYDTRIPVRIEGCEVDDVFHSSFRNGGYRKKYGRAESRLTAMKAESANIL